jgi:hypothetical protein
LSLALLAAFAPACEHVLGADFSDLVPLEDAGSQVSSGGTSGNAGSGVTKSDAGSDSSAGIDADSSVAGASGQGGTLGSGGSSGAAGLGGSSGNAGSAGTAAVDGGGRGATDAGNDGTAGSTCAPGTLDADAATGDASDVVINEVQGVSPDYVELYNTGSAPVDLSGYKLGDGKLQADGGILPCDKDYALFPAGTIVPPHGFLLIEANQPSEGPVCCLGATAPCYRAPFGVSKDGERVYFCRPNKSVISFADYPGNLSEGESWGRFPDGAITFGPRQITPGRPNQDF